MTRPTLTSGYAVFAEPATRPAPPRDPERPSAPLIAAPGRESDARAAERALAALLALTAGDERMESEVRRALIRAGVVRVERSE